MDKDDLEDAQFCDHCFKEWLLDQPVGFIDFLYSYWKFNKQVLEEQEKASKLNKDLDVAWRVFITKKKPDGF